MNRVETFLTVVDEAWNPPAPGKTTLRIIGASALSLQSAYDRGSRDADVIETADLSKEVKNSLLKLAGPGTPLATRTSLYIQFVAPAIPFLPQKPLFHAVPSLAWLQHLSVEVLDATDVAVSKLKPFRPRDIADIKAMAESGKVEAQRLLARFRAAVDWYSLDARAEEDLPRLQRNLNTVQRDIFDVPETPFDSDS